jgi:hypothetical protein
MTAAIHTPGPIASATRPRGLSSLITPGLSPTPRRLVQHRDRHAAVAGGVGVGAVSRLAGGEGADLGHREAGSEGAELSHRQAGSEGAVLSHRQAGSEGAVLSHREADSEGAVLSHREAGGGSVPPFPAAR